MNVRKFTASTSREAWRMVREALGPDAVILSNRTVDGGVEILALAGEDMASLAEPVVERPAISAQTLSVLAPKKTERKTATAEAPALSFNAQSAVIAPQIAVNPPVVAPVAVPDVNRDELNNLMSEIRSMRGMLEVQLAELAWSGDQQKREPAKSSVLREMLAAGFSASLARYMIERMPAGATHQGGMDWIKSVLTRNLATIGNENEILEKGGVYALVGPTGVGKTTTTAKLAARCVMRHGPGKLALITTDGYRIGGYEQLRIYGKILGVMVHSVRDEADLRIALDELKGKHTVLIDTVGVSQRDKMVAEQIAMLSAAGSQVKRLLCLNATSTGETLNEVARSYMGDGLAGCILTKLDEAATIGSALDVTIRQKLNLYYVANGQRVPEDLHVANQQYLIDRAFKLKRETAPFQFNDAEIPLVMANTARAMKDKSLREVILG
ncbi:MAG TPA: flagellar biosynthesis protein FlhF [Oxalicibacterium sp.]|uniref:flagellar biosynthesis protein FlhF n=1 Tax=Oxalicibacterium sp. TaxID=2766525 RepID=UPI002CB0AAC4|nr:flagellar biosynthesis protein FlhF [Oxalicibacterium sp.]HWU97345.1 flagellar biosynthesis protein FlhF [Oxalicibacterium sp.]